MVDRSSPGSEQACVNTDRHLWPQTSEDAYAPSLFVTADGEGIGINVGGSVYVKTLREWHRLAGGPIGIRDEKEWHRELIDREPDHGQYVTRCPDAAATPSEPEWLGPCCPFCGGDPFHRTDAGEAVAVVCCDLGDLFFRGARKAPEEVTLSWDDFTEIGGRLAATRHVAQCAPASLEQAAVETELFFMLTSFMDDGEAAPSPEGS